MFSKTKSIYYKDANILSAKPSIVKSRNEIVVQNNKFIAAPMPSIIGSNFIRSAIALGISVPVHRFNKPTEEVDLVRECLYYKKNFNSQSNIWASIGLKDYQDRLDPIRPFIKDGQVGILLDVANGYSLEIGEFIRSLHKEYSPKVLCAGNIHTPQGFEFLQNLGCDAVRVGIASGCLGAGTKILMSDGSYKDIEKIQIHDKVINMHGKAVEVVGVKFSGIKKVIKYKPGLFYKNTFVTPDHKHWVSKKSFREPRNRESISKILESEMYWENIDKCGWRTMTLPKNIDFDIPSSFNEDINHFFIARRNYNYEKMSFPVLTPSYELGYIFGTFLGDGHSRISEYKNGKQNRKANTHGSTKWYFGINELDLAEKVKECIKKIFNLNAKIKQSRNMQIVTVHCNAFSRFLKTFGKRHSKHLPKKLFCSNKNYLTGIYDGLVDSDGHYSKNNTSFTNTSESLIELFMLISKLIKGYYPSIDVNRRSYGKLRWENKNLSNLHQSYTCRDVKRPEWILSENYQINKVYETKDVEIEIPTYDIEVNCPSHSFIANNLIVHNSACDTASKTGVNRGQITEISEIYRLGIRTADSIADGGIKGPDDVAKAFGAGADCVMLGSVFSKAKEAECNITGEGLYYGGASALGKARTGSDNNRYIEGKILQVPLNEVKPLSDIFNELLDGLRSAISYSGYNNLNDYIGNAVFEIKQ